MEKQRKQNMASHSLESEFVSYEQAVALKELEFDEKCFCYFDNERELRTCIGLNNWNSHEGFPLFVSAPLKQQAFRWFREKGYSFNIMADNAILNSNYFYDIWYNTKFMIETDYDYSTYEEAENACIDKLIELVK